MRLKFENSGHKVEGTNCVLYKLSYNETIKCYCMNENCLVMNWYKFGIITKCGW